MYDEILHLRRKPFCRYYLQVFSGKEILKCFFFNFFRINGRKMIKMPRKGECVKFKKL